MTVLYFDQYNGSEIIRDNAGQEIADLTALRKEATLTVRELVAIVLDRGEAIDDRELRVRTAAGLTVMTVPFKDTLGIDRP